MWLRIRVIRDVDRDWSGFVGRTASCLPREAGGGPLDEARLISIGGGLAGRCSDNASSPAESGPAQEAAKRAG